MKRRRIVLVLFGLSAPRAVTAQSNIFDLRFFEHDRHGRLVYQFFSYSRLLADGRYVVEAFHLRLPTAKYTESGIGAGFTPSVVKHLSTTVVAQIARGSDATYFEPALALSAANGRVASSLFVQRYTPIDSRGATQWLVDPLDIQLSVGPRVSVGVSSYYWRPQGGPALTKVGGIIGLTISSAVVQVAVRRVNQGAGLNTQLRTTVSF